MSRLMKGFIWDLLQCIMLEIHKRKILEWTPHEF